MKKIIKYFSLLVFCFIGMSIVKASTDIVDFKDEIFTFPSSYSNENADSNYVTSLKEGTLFSKWINIDNLSNYQSILDNINTSCDPYYADLENEEKKTVCDKAMSDAATSGVFPGIVTEGSWSDAGTGTRVNINSDLAQGKWISWVATTTISGGNYYGYKVYDITKKVEDETPTEPDTPTTPDTQTTPTTPTTPSNNQSSNPSTGISNILLFIVPFVIAVGIILTIKKNKYEYKD